MASRSVTVTLVNQTMYSLMKEDENLDHGEWNSHPPQEISPFNLANWSTESSGLLTGTEGSVTYHVLLITSDSVGIPSPDPDHLFIHWDNPWLGSNSYDQSVGLDVEVLRDGGGGDNASVAFTLAYSIDKVYIRLGGANGFLGPAVSDETVAPDGVGRFRHYQNGSIYSTPQTAPHEVHGRIRDKWSSLGWERSFLGYPMTDETGTPDGVGRFNHFQDGSIYWTPQTDAHEVHGLIHEKWASLGFERSSLGYPTSDELAAPDGVGRVSNFQRGSIYWSNQTGAVVHPNFVPPIGPVLKNEAVHVPDPDK
ncbi:MAG: LGFP repeat-containing protein [Ktedonobacteraceae bacterium]